MWLRAFPLVLTLSGCVRGVAASAVDAGAGGPVLPRDAGWLLQPSALDAWLRWQAVTGLVAIADGGSALERAAGAARREAAAMAAVGLTYEEVDRIESAVAEAVTQWHVERLTLAAARAPSAESEGADVPHGAGDGGAASGGRLGLASARLEARLGSETTSALLSRRAEVMKAWDALVEPKGERR